jgi:hypothetical protein
MWTASYVPTSLRKCPSWRESVPGVDCWGCIIAAVEDRTVEFQCNERGAMVGKGR